MFKLHPLAIEPVLDTLLSATYKAHVPLGLNPPKVPFNREVGGKYGAGGAGAGIEMRAVPDGLNVPVVIGLGTPEGAVSSKVTSIVATALNPPTPAISMNDLPFGLTNTICTSFG